MNKNKQPTQTKPHKHKFFTDDFILRWALSITAFVAIFTFALSSILGYQLDLQNINFVPSGIIQVIVTPPGSAVSINGQNLSFLSNNRVSLPGGNYLVNVSRDGYHDWQSVLPVKLKTVWWAEARLVPKVKQVATLKTYDSLLSSYASPDRKWILNHLSLNQFELIGVQGDKPVYNSIDFDALLGANNQIAVEFYDWNLAANAIVFRGQAPDGTKTTYSVEMNGKRNLTNLSVAYPDIAFDQIKIASGDGKTQFVLSEGGLYRINLDRPKLYSLVADNVLEYRILNYNQILFTQQSPGGVALKIYDHVKEQSYLINLVSEADSVLFEAFENKSDGSYYVAMVVDNRFQVWHSDFRDLKVPASVDELLAAKKDVAESDDMVLQQFKLTNPGFKDYYFAYLDSVPKQISVAGDGRFVLLDLGQAMMSSDDYVTIAKQMQGIVGQDSPEVTLPLANQDGLVLAPFHNFKLLDTNYRMTFDLKLGVDAGSSSLSEAKLAPTWLTNDIVWENQFGVIRIKDYNGQNQHKLIPADSKFDIQLSNNEKYLYFFQTIDGLPTLRRLNMILN